jgi:hypothetical protein
MRVWYEQKWPFCASAPSLSFSVSQRTIARAITQANKLKFINVIGEILEMRFRILCNNCNREHPKMWNSVHNLPICTVATAVKVTHTSAKENREKWEKIYLKIVFTALERIFFLRLGGLHKNHTSVSFFISRKNLLPFGLLSSLPSAVPSTQVVFNKSTSGQFLGSFRTGHFLTAFPS